jgi:septal ring factor EnvC (AmiA/AmiB activator)
MSYVAISVLIAFTGVTISYLAFRKNGDNDLIDHAEKDGEVKTKLDYISKGVDDIRLDIRAQDRKISDITERVIRVEESTKSAHRRIDGIEKEDYRDNL